MRDNKAKKDKPNLSNTSRFILLPLAFLLYSYGSISAGIVFAIIFVSFMRGDLDGIQGLAIERFLIIAIGLVILVPARKFLNKMLDNFK